MSTSEALSVQRMLSRLSPQEQDALKQFQSIVAPASPDLIAACWFLKSEKWEPPEGARAYQNSMEWRASRGIDKLLRAPSPFSEEVQGILDEVFALRLLKCCDLRGRPVLYVPYRHIDIPTLAKRGITQEHLVQRYLLEMERLRLAIRASRDPLAGHLMIADVAGVTPLHFMRSRSFYAEVSRLGNVSVTACCIE
ncbi:MAG: hypothetical protein SGPRY_004180 [Prymnesium sp.]